MENFENISNKIEQLSELKQKISNILQDEIFDFVGFRKFQNLQKKASLFRFGGKVYVGNDLRNARPLHQHTRFELLDSSNHNWIDFKPSVGSIVLMTNNDIGSNLLKYIKCYENNIDSLFIVWDWDSQHWTYMSSMLGLHSDFYISGGSENAFFLSHFNPAIIGPIWGGAYQWSRDFIIENISVLLRERINAPLGVHIPYENFPRRNRAITTVTQKFPTVRFGNNDYKSKTDLENLQEWATHKTHWVMPVMGGLPLRGYNALLTGGIPILPSFLKNFPEVSILGNIPLYYEVSDLIEPEAIHWAGVEKFDRLGRDGVLQRVLDGLSKYHIDTRCESILRLTDLSLERIRNGDRTYPDGYYLMK